mmetsp:Transcript_4685/g.6438  ORF Transcript_4685/g.6438 Transcript_4685/m.6438 type:complete len:82 (-) Transcript_4685:11-256(-)
MNACQNQPHHNRLCAFRKTLRLFVSIFQKGKAWLWEIIESVYEEFPAWAKWKLFDVLFFLAIHFLVKYCRSFDCLEWLLDV